MAAPLIFASPGTLAPVIVIAAGCARAETAKGRGESKVKLIIQWLISVVAIAITTRIVPGITIVGEEWKGLAVAAVMLVLANLLIRPLLTLISRPLTVVTFGLFWFVVGGIVLVVSSWLSLRLFDAGIVIDGILPAILGALVIAIISGVLGFFLIRDRD
jgi:putative membrane protein